MNARTFLLHERAQGWCDLKGRERYMACRSRGARSATPLGDESRQIRMDATGVAGEQVVRWYFGCPCFIEHDRAAWDLDAYGVRIDVKSTEYRHGKLALNGKQASSADAYVLVIRTGDAYEIAGWMPAEELKQDGNWERYFPNGWAVPQDELRDIEDLAEWAAASGYLESRPGLPREGGPPGLARLWAALLSKTDNPGAKGGHGTHRSSGQH